MFEYIAGKIIESSPAYLILENNQTGYFIHVSVNTYSQLPQPGEVCKIFLHQVIREDAHLLFGFIDRAEREMFRQLISVSGIGANTARMILSSFSPNDLREAIMEGNVNLLKSIKGIGLKSAQRLIVDLKDKVGKPTTGSEIFAGMNNTIKDESLSALVMLGFGKSVAEKVVDKILTDNKTITLEDLVKEALKKL
ncbi:MAG TPA: Holliday junction branch migration protein RuvA [Bacteroidales bacterium]|nr:Holliday junction branch migration protein RuvA [Bacteroidales bacterium]